MVVVWVRLQFIPSTWQLLEPDIATYTNKSVPDPFNAQDAFMASAIYLSNLGASGGTATPNVMPLVNIIQGNLVPPRVTMDFMVMMLCRLPLRIQSNINLIENN